jgi:hypothetical protein
MTKYKMGINLIVEGLDGDDALYNYDRIKELNGIVDVDCFDIEEIA